MIRTQIYLSEEEREGLHAIARDKKKSQSEIIREAVDEYIKKQKRESKTKTIQNMIGIWKDRTDHLDFDSLRREWNRGTSDE
jgi:metal-responsive CopG/Arc/MetJ family transcriptional regulator